MEQGYTIEQKPHGYVRYIDHHGSDLRIVEAARISYKSPSKGDEQDKKLLQYLYRNRHTSPFEQCNITFNIKFPIFLMRQFVRHRTFRLNEVSARYTELPDEFYLPEKWRAQDTKNKQGSVNYDTVDQNVAIVLARDSYAHCYRAYEMMIKDGVSKEQARFILPVGIYTEIYVNIDLHNLMHFLRLRLDSHAQLEMREVAKAMHDIALELFPWTFQAFRKFKLKVEEAIENE